MHNLVAFHMLPITLALENLLHIYKYIWTRNKSFYHHHHHRKEA